MMVPAFPGGFCFAQYIIMTLILYGVHLANVVWSKTTDDIKMGATPTQTNGLTTTLNNIGAQLYEYSALNEIISKKITSAKSNTIKESTGVLLQKYPAFESIAHALSSGSYLYSQSTNSFSKNTTIYNYEKNEDGTYNTHSINNKPDINNIGIQECTKHGMLLSNIKQNDNPRNNPGMVVKESTIWHLKSWHFVPNISTTYSYNVTCKPKENSNVSAYQPGEMVLSNITFENSEITSIPSFEDRVLENHGTVFSAPFYNKGGLDYSGTNKENIENKREKALVAPLGFDLGSIPENWNPPILASSSSSLFYNDGISPSDDTLFIDNNISTYMKNHPSIRSYPSYNPGGYDCRKLIGQSSSQNYNLLGWKMQKLLKKC